MVVAVAVGGGGGMVVAATKTRVATTAASGNAARRTAVAAITSVAPVASLAAAQRRRKGFVVFQIHVGTVRHVEIGTNFHGTIAVGGERIGGIVGLPFVVLLREMGHVV